MVYLSYISGGGVVDMMPTTIAEVLRHYLARWWVEFEGVLQCVIRCDGLRGGRFRCFEHVNKKARNPRKFSMFLQKWKQSRCILQRWYHCLAILEDDRLFLLTCRTSMGSFFHKNHWTLCFAKLKLFSGRAAAAHKNFGESDDCQAWLRCKHQFEGWRYGWRNHPGKEIETDRVLLGASTRIHVWHVDAFLSTCTVTTKNHVRKKYHTWILWSCYI